MTDYRRDVLPLDLVIVDVVVVAAWVIALATLGPVSSPFEPGQPMYFFPPVLFVLLGAAGFGMLQRMGRARRRHSIARCLWLSSGLVLLPLALYVYVAYLSFAVRDL